MPSRYSTPIAPPDEPTLPHRADFIAPIDRDEGEGRRRGPSKGPAKSAQAKKKAATGREAPKERGGKWRYKPSDDY